MFGIRLQMNSNVADPVAEGYFCDGDAADAMFVSEQLQPVRKWYGFINISQPVMDGGIPIINILAREGYINQVRRILHAELTTWKKQRFKV